MQSSMAAIAAGAPAPQHGAICSGWRDNSGDSPIEQMSLYEALFTLNIEFANPYDPEQVEVDALFRLPDGETISVPAFWHEEYTRSLVKGQEILRTTGELGWRLRFTPPQAGDYSYELVVVDHTKGTAHAVHHIGPFSFTTVTAYDPGFLRLSARDSAYLEFENGQPYVGIGHNLCGWEWGGTDNRQGTFEYDAWLLALAENGANMAQFDFCEGDQLEWTAHPTELPFSRYWRGLNHYNQQTAWKMDARIRRADELGIYARLSLLHWEDFDDEAENFPDWGWNRNPYNNANGGPVATVRAFFSDPTARHIFKKQLRYIVARWGYARSILAFELWNEVDAEAMIWGDGETYESSEHDIIAWHDEMATFLKSIDPNDHLITTSCAHTFNGAGFWSLSQMDFTTFHRYTYYNDIYGEAQYSTVEALHKLITDRLRDTNKPVLGGEFALSPGGDIQKERDPVGLALHQQLWSSIMLKSLGTAMHWTWGSYMHDYDLYHHYRPLSRFLLDEDLRGLQPFDKMDELAQPIRYLGLRSDRRALVWVQDRGYDFPAMAAGHEPGTIAGQVLSLSGLSNGDYLVESYDCWTGQLLARESLAVGSAPLQVELPPFTRDIAIKVRPSSERIDWISKDIGGAKTASATEILGHRVVVTASNGGVGQAGDKFRYVYVAISGDFSLTAQICSLTNLGEFVRSGLMARLDETEGSPFVYLATNPTGKVSLLGREQSGAAEINVSPAQDAGFYWRYRLQRRGDTLSGSVSRDGAAWEQVGQSVTVAWSQTALIGFAMASKDDYTYVCSEFNDVRLTTGTADLTGENSQ